MRAAVHTRYGPPHVVRVSEVTQPNAGQGEVLVRVRATTVNRTDCANRAARPFFIRLFSGIIAPRMTVLGSEFAGDIEAVGAGVTSFEVGDRVFGYNEGPFGAHAEYLVVAATGALATMPENLSYAEVAPATEGAHYALVQIRAAGVQSGQEVLVYGATGAIGSAAVQLLKSLGARVTAVCATDALGLVRGLGADTVIDYTTQDFTSGDQRYDMILDAVGKISFGQCKPLLNPGGIYISTELGAWAQNPFLALIGRLHNGKRVLFPIPRHDQEMVVHLKGLLESGKFKPVVDRAYGLDQIVDAYGYVETGQKIGSVVIMIDGLPAP